jgi:hypothetical protein
VGGTSRSLLMNQDGDSLSAGARVPAVPGVPGCGARVRCQGAGCQGALTGARVRRGAPMWLAALSALVVLAAGTRPVEAAAVIDGVAVTPGTAAVGVATPVTVTALITEPSVVANGVLLQRLDAAGRVVAVVGYLRDDGTAGDATAGDRTFTLQFTLFETTPGPVRLRVSAPFAGVLLRVLSSVLTVNVVGTATGIAILAPANLAYVNTSPVVVSGTVGDAGATVTVNGIAAPVNGTNFQVTVPLVEGTNTLTAVAANTGGTTSTASVQVTLDTTPPQVTIESPGDGLVTGEATVTVAGTVNDIVVGTVNLEQATVTVAGVAAAVANRSFLAPGVPLALGPNTLQAVARDRAGNQATTTVHVTRVVPAEPFIRVVSGNNQSGSIASLLGAPLVAEVRDAVGQAVAGVPVVFRVVDNNGTLTGGGTSGAAVVVASNAQGRAQATLRLGSRSGAGSNRVEATAAGYTGVAAFTASGTPTAAALIAVDTGNGQTGALGERLALPFVVVVTDAGFNRVGGVPVRFAVKAGGGSIAGQALVTTNTDPDGRALALLTLGTEPGYDNNVVEASFTGNPGLPATFVASAKAPGTAADTAVTGVVLDNSNQPIAGVTIRLFLTHQGHVNNTPIPVGDPVETDAAGTFRMQPAPVGVFKLMADGTTVTPARGTFPTLEYDLVTVAGQANTVGQPIYLPALDTVNQICVSETTGGTLTLPEVPGFSLTVFAGSATFPGGARTGCVTVSAVNADKVPMAPGFGQQPRFIVTIQPVGTTFNPPAPITMPNVDGLVPGQVTELYSYDHDLAAFVAIGTGTVTADGLLIRSDPGVGILKAGWHCGGDPNSTGQAASLSVSINPTKFVKGVDNQFNVTANGRPPLDGTYSWQILATQPGDDATAAQLVQSPACNNQPSCTAVVKGIKGGKATIRVRFRCTTTGAEVTADARLIIVKVDRIDATINANVVVVPAAPTMTHTSTRQVATGALQWPADLWTAPTPMVLVRQSLTDVPLKVTTTPPATDPDVDVAFQVLRAPDDAAGVGGPNDRPALTKDGKDSAKLGTNQRGSFQVLAYIDSNGNGQRDNDETGVTLPTLLVHTTFNRSLSVANSGNINYVRSANPMGTWTGSAVTTGQFTINTPANAGVYLAAEVDFIGGGADGRRGVDRVFGGWVNNETADEDIVGSYQNMHVVTSIFATNRAAATGNFAGPMFLPGDPAPVLQAAPLLDTGRASPGTGGNSSTLSTSRVGTTTNLALGQRKLIETVDSPGQPYPIDHPGFAGNRLTQARFNLDFGAFLTLWSNVTAVITPSGNVADRTYVVIHEQPWTIRATFNIDATGNGTAVGTPAIALGAATTRNPVVPVTSTTAIMVPPTGLSLLALDARN